MARNDFLYVAQLPDTVAQYMSTRFEPKEILPIIQILMDIRKKEWKPTYIQSNIGTIMPFLLNGFQPTKTIIIDGKISFSSLVFENKRIENVLFRDCTFVNISFNKTYFNNGDISLNSKGWPVDTLGSLAEIKISRIERIYLGDMKKFKVTVTRTVDYEVEIDETLWSAEEREKWQQTFWDLNPTDYESENPDDEAAAEFAVALAEQSVRLGCNQFIEGFGMCAQDKEYAESWNKMKHSDGTNLCTNGLYIREGDEYTESEIEEMDD